VKGAAVVLVLVALAGVGLWAVASAQRAALRRAAGVPRKLGPIPPLTTHWWTAEDIACARSIATAKFGPNATVTLPSGRVVLGVDIPRIAAIGRDRDA
jgi:hypothetical protein